MAGPKREDGSPAERLSGKVVMEGSFLTGELKSTEDVMIRFSRMSHVTDSETRYKLRWYRGIFALCMHVMCM